MTYQFIATYHYGPSERYNNGRGLHALGLTLERAELLASVFCGRDEPYATRIMLGDEVIAESGNFDAAERSTRMAINARRAA